jgi:hypothetical protein
LVVVVVYLVVVYLVVVYLVVVVYQVVYLVFFVLSTLYRPFNAAYYFPYTTYCFSKSLTNPCKA